MSVVMGLAAAMLFAIGTYVVLQRKLSRIIIGLGLISHGANVLLLMSGERGTPPLIGRGDPESFSDPLPQALALTAIVITFAVTAFLLAMAYRSWMLTEDDEVQDDVGDRLIAAAGYRDADQDDIDDGYTPEQSA
jgi:multicomponent Na+:H+ antiporter subunit C